MSEEQQNKELREFFRDNYTDQPEVVSPAVWEGVVARLTEKRKRRGGLYWLLGGLLLLPLGIASIYLFNGMEEDAISPLAKSEPTDRQNIPEESSKALTDDRALEAGATAGIRAIDQTTTSDSGSGSRLQEVDHSAVVQVDSYIRGVKIHPKAEDSQKPQGNGSRGSVEAKTNKIVPVEMEFVTSEPISRITNRTADAKNPTITLADLGPADQADTSARKTTADPIDQPSGSESGPEVVTTGTEEQRVQQMDERINVSTLANPDIDSIPLYVSVGQPDTVGITMPKPKISYWQLAVYAGYGRQNRLITDNSPDDLNSNKFTALHPTRKFYRQSGLQLTYNVNPYIGLQFGLQTALWRYHSREFQKRIAYTTTTYELDAPIGRVQTTSADLDPFYSTTTTTDTLLFRIRMRQNLRYVSLPLSVKIKFSSGVFRPYTRLGIQANYLVWQRTNLLFVGSGIERNIEFKNINGIKKFHLSVMGAFGLEWDLLPRLGMFAEGQLNIPLSRFYQAPPGSGQTIRTRGLGANVGLMFRL